MSDSLKDQLNKPVERFTTEFKQAWDEADYPHALNKLQSLIELIRSLLVIDQTTRKL